MTAQLCHKKLHLLTGDNMTADGRCRACTRDYHRDYYYKRNAPSTIILLANLVIALDGDDPQHVKLALDAARQRVIQQGRYDANRSADDSEGEEATA